LFGWRCEWSILCCSVLFYLLYDFSVTPLSRKFWLSGMEAGITQYPRRICVFMVGTNNVLHETVL
jgi:hypothetical protein